MPSTCFWGLLVGLCIMGYASAFFRAEAPAVLGFNGSVGPHFDRQDKILGRQGVCEVALAGDELAELGDQHFGDFDLGFALGGVDHG